MPTAEHKRKILDWLSQHQTAVLATADLKGNPAAAVILLAVIDDLKIIFGTHPTRKYQNLRVNPNVAVVVAEGLASVQYHGQARELSGAESIEARKVFLIRHPAASQHLLEGTRFFKVTPTWVRYMDLARGPEATIELKLSTADWH